MLRAHSTQHTPRAQNYVRWFLESLETAAMCERIYISQAAVGVRGGMLLHVCPRTATYVSLYYYIVLELLHMCI